MTAPNATEAIGPPLPSTLHLARTQRPRNNPKTILLIFKGKQQAEAGLQAMGLPTTAHRLFPDRGLHTSADLAEEIQAANTTVDRSREAACKTYVAAPTCMTREALSAALPLYKSGHRLPRIDV